VRCPACFFPFWVCKQVKHRHFLVLAFISFF
jgi:hypothetical protein